MKKSTFSKFVILFLALYVPHLAQAQLSGRYYSTCGDEVFAVAEVQNAHNLVSQTRYSDSYFIEQALRDFGFDNWESDPYNIDFDLARILNAVWLLKNSGYVPFFGNVYQHAKSKIDILKPGCDLGGGNCADAGACYTPVYSHDGGLDWDKLGRVVFRRSTIIQGSPLFLASLLIHEAAHEVEIRHLDWENKGAYPRQFYWLAWFAANGRPSGFTEAETLQFRQEAAQIANYLNSEHSNIRQALVVHNPNVNRAPINANSDAWTLPFPQAYSVAGTNANTLGEPSFYHSGWDTPEECRAPENHVVTGFGGRIANNSRITTLHLNVRPILPNRQLGDVITVRCGIDPNHSIEKFINAPPGHVITGFGASSYKNNFSALTIYSRRWDPTKGELVGGLETNYVGGTKTEQRFLPLAISQNAVVGIGLRNYESNITGIAAYLRSMDSSSQ